MNRDLYFCFSFLKTNYKAGLRHIPIWEAKLIKSAKTQKLEDLTYEMVVDIIAAEEKTSVKKAPTAAKKAAPKKVAAKKKVSK